MELREYQSQAVQRVREAIRSGARSVLLVAPTGSGKTVIAGHILHAASVKNRPSLFIAHRRELIQQASHKLTQFGVEHGLLISGETPSLMAETQVASIQTFASRVFKRKKIQAPTADLLVIDEAHHATANSYLLLKEQYPDSVFLGLTATPCRTDGRGLGKFFDAIVEITTPQELIDLGFLVPTRVVAPRLPDLRGLKTKCGDYDEPELEKRMVPMIGDLVRDWQLYAQNRQTFVFAVTVAHSIWIQQKFEDAGIACAHVDGETPTPRRDQIFADFAAGRIKVLTNVGITTEGIDIPEVSCAVLARPTKSYGLYIQMAGRICRPFPGKTDALLIDHSGAVYRHGFPQDAGGWELDEKFSMTEKNQERLAKEPQPITCRECFTVYSGQIHCPCCGAVPNKVAKSLTMEEGRLYEVSRKRKPVVNFTMAQKADWYSQLKQLELIGEKKTGWAAHKYREKFDVWPNHPSIRGAPYRKPTEEVINFVRSRNIAFAKRRSA